jgi:hypothetical protein
MKTQKKSPHRRNPARYRRLLLLVGLMALGCTAQANAPGWEVSVLVIGRGDGDGLVTSQTSPVSISCLVRDGSSHSGGNCDDEFMDAGMGGTFDLLAAPAPGHLFGGWSGACSGTELRCTVTLPDPRPPRITVYASFLRVPESIAVSVADPALNTGESTAATLTVTPSVADTTTFTWTSSDPGVVAVTPQTSGGAATVTAVGPGTATILASARTQTSAPVTLTVTDAPPVPGILQGVLYDVDGVTPLDSVYLSMRMVNAPAGSPTYRTWTGPQGEETVPAGGFAFEVNPAPWAVFTVGVVGKRYLTTPGDTAVVTAGQTTHLDLNVRRGYHLDMRDTDLGTLTAGPGEAIDLVVDFTTWCRDGGAACATSLALGVDDVPLAVYRFDPPGAYATGGRTETGVTIPVTAPASGGTLYAFLVTTSTSEASGGVQKGLDQYATMWAQGLEGTTMIPLGTLTVQ